MITPQNQNIDQKTKIFAYLRRSTNKLEQSESLIQQEDGIFSIIKKLGFEKENIRYFAETKSGFENKNRPQWTEMLSEISSLKSPCIILTRDISRLARNPNDHLKLMNLIYGDNKSKILIDKIYYLDVDSIGIADRNTDKEILHKHFSSTYYDSLDTKKKSIGGILIKLESGQFTYRAPKGLDNFQLNGRRILRQNDKMPYIRKAFEMRIEGKTLKEISKYLKIFGDISISSTDLTERIFTNTVYIGQYREKTTNTVFNNLEFLEKYPPLQLTIWNKVQALHGKKISKYGANQEGDVLSEKLRTKEGKRMSKYTIKGYNQYKNTIENIHISERNILNGFLQKIQSLIEDINFNLFVLIKDSVLALAPKKEFDREKIINETKKFLELGGISFDNLGFLQESHNSYQGLDSNMRKAKIEELRNQLYYQIGSQNSILTEFLKENGLMGNPNISFTDFLKEMSFEIFSCLASKDSEKEINNLKDLHKKEILKLEKKKAEIEKERLSFIKLLANNKINESDYDELIKENQRSIDILLEKIEEFEEGTEKEIFLNRLPEILSKIFELSNNLSKKKGIEDFKSDLLKLLEITTFELTVDNQKELKIKLFDTLDRLISSKKSILEVLTCSNLRTFVENFDNVSARYGINF